MIINIIKLGNNERPVSKEEIEEFKNDLQKVINGESGSNILITNNDIQIITADIDMSVEINGNEL